MSRQPSASVDFSLSHHSDFVPSSLSFGEKRGQHVHCVLSQLVLASLGWTSIGWSWSWGFMDDSYWKEAMAPIKVVLWLHSQTFRKLTGPSLFQKSAI